MKHYQIERVITNIYPEPYAGLMNSTKVELVGIRVITPILLQDESGDMSVGESRNLYLKDVYLAEIAAGIIPALQIELGDLTSEAITAAGWV